MNAIVVILPSTEVRNEALCQIIFDLANLSETRINDAEHQGQIVYHVHMFRSQ